MAINKRRDKYLIFRLTQDEYEALQNASSGARSLSDYARTRLLQSLETPAIDEQLVELRSSVAHIAALLEKH